MHAINLSPHHRYSPEMTADTFPSLENQPKAAFYCRPNAQGRFPLYWLSGVQYQNLLLKFDKERIWQIIPKTDIACFLKISCNNIQNIHAAAMTANFNDALL